MKLDKILLGILAIIELSFFIVFRDRFIQWFPFLQESSTGYYDDIILNITASLVYFLVQGINWCLINFIFKFKKILFQLLSFLFNVHKKMILKNINNMINFTFSIEVKWGPNTNSKESKIANTSEALISSIDAIESGINLTPSCKSTLNAIAKKLLGKITEDGYKSYNEDVYTVHCTSMALYALKRCDDYKIITISKNEKKIINKCLKKLLSNASDIGWGFENKKYNDQLYIRVFSTIWALRALNIWGFSNNETFCLIFNNLTINSFGLIGFSKSDSVRPTTTAMLDILIEELENDDLKKSYLKSVEIKEIMHFLCSDIPEIEFERYNIDKGYNNTRSWTHLSECLIVKTLIKNLNSLNCFQTIKVAWQIKKICDKIDKNQHYYGVNAINNASFDPTFYPTTYAISALSCLINENNKKSIKDNQNKKTFHTAS